MSTKCARKGCTRTVTDIPYCADCLRHIKLGHDHKCTDNTIWWIGTIAICNGCRSNSALLDICKCVRKDDPPERIRTHTSQTIMQGCISAYAMHYIPDDFPTVYDYEICPRQQNYRPCGGLNRSPKCHTITHVRYYMCSECVKVNQCAHCNKGCLRESDPLVNNQVRACCNHVVCECATCARPFVLKDPCSRGRRKQCPSCDIKTNTIICCDVVHRPHTLSFPCPSVHKGYCAMHYDNYWALIQDKTIWQLYKTISASPLRRRMSFARALLLRLTWQSGNVNVITDPCAIDQYILSQYDCAASALMRVRWLPQPLRLMILRYV